MRCKKEKADEAFAWRYKTHGVRQKACRECMAFYHTQSYPKWKETRDPEAERERQRVKIRRARSFCVDYLKTHPCVDCGFSNIVALDFDHVIKTGKYNPYTRLNKLIQHGYSIDRIKQEIAKCAVRCANCHRIKTAKEQGWFKTLEQNPEG